MQLADHRRRIREEVTSQLGDAFGLQVVDMNDGRARVQPPQDTCLAAVRSSEFMVLLVDDSYGQPAPGSERSFTHLEYDEAMRSGSRTKVLCYLISRYPIGDPGEGQLPALLRQWRKTLQANHTPVRFAPDEGVDVVGARVARDLHLHLVEWLRRSRPGAAAEPVEEVTLELDERPIDEALLDQLENRRARPSADATEPKHDMPDGPASTAAHEQAALSEHALQLGELEVAITHLQRSLEQVPLRPRLQYRLATLYLAQPTRQRLQKASAYLEQASRVFEATDHPFWAAACLIALARVRLALDAANVESAVAASTRAVEICDTFRSARYEHARVLAEAGKGEAALEQIDALAKLTPVYLSNAWRDPAFAACKTALQERLAKVRRRMNQTGAVLTRLGHEIAMLDGAVPSSALATGGLQALSMPAGFTDQSATQMIQSLHAFNRTFLQRLRQAGRTRYRELTAAFPEQFAHKASANRQGSDFARSGAREREAIESDKATLQQEVVAQRKVGFRTAGCLGAAVLFWGLNAPVWVLALILGLGLVFGWSAWHQYSRSQQLRRRIDLDEKRITDRLQSRRADVESGWQQWRCILQQWEHAIDDLPAAAVPVRGVRTAGRGEIVRARPSLVRGDSSAFQGLKVQMDGSSFDDDTSDVRRLYVVLDHVADSLTLSRYGLVSAKDLTTP